MYHHQLSQKKSGEIARAQSLATDIDTAAPGNALVQDHAIQEIEAVVTVVIEAVTEAAIVVATAIEADDRVLIVEEIDHPQGIEDEIEVDDIEAEAGVDQEIDHLEEESRKVDQEVDLVLDQGLLESDLKIPRKRLKKMDEIVLKPLIKKPVMRIVQNPQGLRNIKSPKNRRRRKKKRKRKNTDVIALVLNLSSASASQGQSRNQSLSRNPSMKNRKSVRNQQRRLKMNSRQLMQVQFETSGKDPRKMMRRTTSSISGKVLAQRSQMTQKKQSKKKKLQRQMMRAKPLQILSAQRINRQRRSSLMHANGNLSIRTKKIMNHPRLKLRMTSHTR